MPGNARISTTKQKYKTINTKRTSPANARNETRNKTKTEKTERWFWLNTTDAEMQAKLRKCKRNFGNSQSSTARSPSKEPVWRLDLTLDDSTYDMTAKQRNLQSAERMARMARRLERHLSHRSYTRRQRYPQEICISNFFTCDSRHSNCCWKDIKVFGPFLQENEKSVRDRSCCNIKLNVYRSFWCWWIFNVCFRKKNIH